MIKNLFSLTDDRNLLSIEIEPSPEENILSTIDEINDEMDEIIDLDVIRGEQRALREKIANISIEMLNVIKKEKKKIDLNSKMIKEKIIRSKDKERHLTVTTLGDMTQEQRDIEDLLKNHRLEKWSKGLQKGLTQYVGTTYDEEREERERIKILEQQVENNALLEQALVADQEIALLEQEENQIVSNRIESDVYDMSDIPDDDIMHEELDDGYRLEYEEE